MLSSMMIRKTVTLTVQQDRWIKDQLISGMYGNESEVLRDLIRQRMIRESEIAEIRTALIEAEQSGVSRLGVDEIWEQAYKRHQSQNA